MVLQAVPKVSQSQLVCSQGVEVDTQEIAQLTQLYLLQEWLLLGPLNGITYTSNTTRLLQS